MGRTSLNCCPALAVGSFVPGGIDTASCETLGGAGWGLGRLLEGFCQPVGEACVEKACANRLTHGNTWVARPTDFPVCALSAPRTGDTQGRRRSRSVGEAATLGYAVLVYPVDPDFPQIAGAHAGDVAMMSQLGWASLASPMAPDFGTITAAVISQCLAPCNMRSGGVPRLSSVGARVLTLSSVRRWGPLAMALGAAGAAFLLAAIQRNLL